MANIKFTNLAGSILQVAINNLATTVTIDPADVTKFPSISGSEYFIIVLITSAGDFEIMRVTDVTSNVFTVVRAQEGTPARAFDIGDKVEHRLTAESLVTIVEEASITKPHTSTDADTYGHATSTLFSHVKITDETNSSAAATLGIGISPYAVKTRFDQLLGASNQNVITASGSFTVPETGTYEVIAVGGGGKGGTGSAGFFTNSCWSYGIEGGQSRHGGTGGAGGGAGQTITAQVALTKDTVVPVTVGSGTSGTTIFGTYVTALGGGPGGVGTNLGTSYGSQAIAGATGGYIECFADSNWGYAYGGNGGAGGISTEGTYGNGGNGGKGGNSGFTQDMGDVNTSGTVGSAGTQGCIKIRLVLGS